MCMNDEESSQVLAKLSTVAVFVAVEFNHD
jgi:hypothetical protein